MNLTKDIVVRCKKWLIFKIITSIFTRALLLIVPIFWSRAIDRITSNTFDKAYFLVIISLILSALYYVWEYLNQKAWYEFYNHLYGEYTDYFIDKTDNVKGLTLGEYANISNEDINVICTFLGNLVTRAIQVLEFLVIYTYFLSLDKYIFLITIIVSLLMIAFLISQSRLISKNNLIRKESLDKKIITIHDLYEKIKIKASEVMSIKRRYIRRNNDYLKANAKFNVLSLGINYIVLTIMEISRYCLILYGIYLITTNHMDIGTIVLIYTYYAKIITNFEVLGTINIDYQSFRVSIDRLDKVNSIEQTT